MARDENIRVSPAVVAQDEAAFNALQKISGYAPSNREHAVESLLAAIDEMHAAQIAEDQTLATAATARDKAAEAEWKVHNLMLGAKDQVKAQFGKDSVQVQEIGLKKTSDYKRPGRKTKSKTLKPAV